MIIGMQGFSAWAASGNIANQTDIRQILSAVRTTHPLNSDKLKLGEFMYLSNSHQFALSPPELVANIGGTSSYFVLQNQTTAFIKEVGDTLTIGARVLMQPAHSTTDPVVGGFSGAAPDSALQMIVSMNDKSSTPYVEIEVTMTDDPTNPYRYRGWVNGVLRLSTVRPNLMTYGYIGSSTPWKNGAVSAGTIIFRDIYWAFNKEGEEERVGPCTVASVPRTVKTGADNPGGENISSARATWALDGGSKPPITLNTPVVMGPNWSLPENTRVKAMKMATIGKPSVVGVSANVTSQIVDHTDAVVASESVENITANYAPGVSVATFDTSNLSMTDIRNFKFVASREKPSKAK